MNNISNAGMQNPAFVGEWEIPRLKITYINGIMNGEKDCLSTAKMISGFYKQAKVYYIFDPSEGFLKDTLSALNMLCFSLENPAVSQLADLWKRCLQEDNGEIVHYAHSRGGLVTKLALQQLSKQEKQRIHLRIFGSPAFFFDRSLGSIVHHINEKDCIPAVNLWRLCYAADHEITIPSSSDACCFEHSIKDSSYSSSLKKFAAEDLRNKYMEPLPLIMEK
ncbi:MAG: hypothetical protein Tsb0015_07760 [Simkaniaceae bacterium]